MECVVKVPEEAIEAYKHADGWKAFWNIVGLNGTGGGQEEEVKICERPQIEYLDGKVVVTCATEGAKCCTSITTDDYKSYDGNEPIELGGVYTVSSFAHAEGYQNSETVTRQINIKGTTSGPEVVEVHDTIYVYDDSRSAIILASGDVMNLLIRDGVVYIEDAPIGSAIEVYKPSGAMYMFKTVETKETSLALPRKELYIIKAGGMTFKVKL